MLELHKERASAYVQANRGQPRRQCSHHISRPSLHTGSLPKRANHANQLPGHQALYHHKKMARGVSLASVAVAMLLLSARGSAALPFPATAFEKDVACPGGGMTCSETETCCKDGDGGGYMCVIREPPLYPLPKQALMAVGPGCF